MTIRGPEPAVNALRERLEQDLPAAIDAVNSDVTDGYTVEHPARVLDYMPPFDTIQSFPTVCIEHGPGRFEDDTGYEATGVYDLTVIAVLSDADQQSLTRKLRRYLLAMTRVTLEGRDLGSGTGIPWGVTVVGFDFGPALADKARKAEEPAAFRSWTELTVRVKLDES